MDSWLKVCRRGIRGYISYNVNDIAKILLELRNTDLALRDTLVQSGQLFEGYHPEMEQNDDHALSSDSSLAIISAAYSSAAKI